MLFTLPLLAALAFSDTSSASPPLAGESAADEVSFVVHYEPAIPLVSLRLSILADDPPGYAGAGHLFQHLLLASLQEQVARVGGSVEAERTSDAIIYTVTGPTAELEYLAGVLRSALRPPAPTDAAVLQASLELQDERMGEWETADQHVRADLRARLFPNDLSAAGTESTAERLTTDVLPGVWARLYRPNRVVVVAVGDVQLPRLQAAFRDVPPAAQDGFLDEVQDTISLTPPAPAEATRAWLGAGYLATDLEPAVLSVAARLLRDDLARRLPDAEVQAEHWWTHYGQAIALVVSTPAKSLPAARRALSSAVSGLKGQVTDEKVSDAVRAIRHDMLFYARTPDRMAEVLGSFADRDGDPNAAEEFYGQLEHVDTDAVQDALDYLVKHSPTAVEIPPQVLNPNL